MRRILVLTLVVGSIVWMGTSAWAQVQGNQEDASARRQRVHQLIVTRLANGLNLSQADAQKLGEALKKHRQRKHQLRRETRELTGQLRQDSASGNQQAMQATLKKLQSTRDQLDRSEDLMFAEVKTLLNPSQLAQFVLIMDEIRHEIRAVRRRGRRQFRDQPGPYPHHQHPSQLQNTLTNQPQPPASWRGSAPPPMSNGLVGN